MASLVGIVAGVCGLVFVTAAVPLPTGHVRLVDSGWADYRVRVVEWGGDHEVKVVDHYPSGINEWKVITSGAADFTVRLVDYGKADFTIEIVEGELIESE